MLDNEELKKYGIEDIGGTVTSSEVYNDPIEECIKAFRLTINERKGRNEVNKKLIMMTSYNATKEEYTFTFTLEDKVMCEYFFKRLSPETTQVRTIIHDEYVRLLEKV